ncbi:hypothetical protein [Devosia sp. CAU 1758]
MDLDVDEQLKRLYVTQVFFQCDCALSARKELNAAWRAEHGDARQIFYALQNMLVACANIAKLLWGQRGGKSAERAPLREFLRIEEPSPFKDIAMRNHFEHLDERLDRWWQASPGHQFTDMCTGQPEDYPADIELDRFRIYSHRTGLLVFWGERFNIHELTEVVIELRDSIIRMGKEH